MGMYTGEYFGGVFRGILGVWIIPHIKELRLIRKLGKQYSTGKNVRS